MAVGSRSSVDAAACAARGRIKGWTKFVAKLQQASGVDFRLHDGRYNKDQAWDGRRDAFTRVSDYVATLIGARD